MALTGTSSAGPVDVQKPAPAAVIVSTRLPDLPLHRPRRRNIERYTAGSLSYRAGCSHRTDTPSPVPLDPAENRSDRPPGTQCDVTPEW